MSSLAKRPQAWAGHWVAACRLVCLAWEGSGIPVRAKAGLRGSIISLAIFGSGDKSAVE